MNYHGQFWRHANSLREHGDLIDEREVQATTAGAEKHLDQIEAEQSVQETNGGEPMDQDVTQPEVRLSCNTGHAPTLADCDRNQRFPVTSNPQQQNHHCHKLKTQSLRQCRRQSSEQVGIWSKAISSRPPKVFFREAR
jgi:hypothetical protein